MILEDRCGPPRVPLDALIDVPLHEADADRIAGARPLAPGHAPAAPEGHCGDSNERDGDRHPPERRRPRDDQIRERGAHRCDEQRQTVDAEQARELRDRQHTRLAVSEQHPREAGKQIRAAELHCHPRERSREDRELPVPDHDPANERREQCRICALIRDQARVDQHGHPPLQVAVREHHGRHPVQGAGEVHGARHETQRERARERARAPRRSADVPGEGDEERRQRDPAERRMTEFREAEDEEDAREERERVISAAGEQDTSSVTRLASCPPA